MVVKSVVTGKTYDTNDGILILNITQITKYLSNGVEVLDIFADKDGKLVFIFDKKSSKNAYKLWLEHKL
ncbi:hypothetical protein KQI61_07830 [Anaerocolumna aminovalerica]|uniref:hypothetical protein n=1 Tax=Anaerocolumna aminovalerica TaxID=1527 RepID=UPI001C0ED15C|nr:hypothetical protein [Anaerocolumna aminovalerica]MBU5332106.1 hypothetical protein [Anaerocolumna aminovalerica]